MKQDEKMSPREKDVRMMQSPLEWPMMLLPLKHTSWKVGFLIGNGCKVYEGNIYDQPLLKRIAEGEYTGTEYESFGAIYDDGWRVD